MLCSVAGLSCASEPLSVPCPQVQTGDLAISEIHGRQTEADTGDWIEIYNDSNDSKDLAGLTIELIKLDGSSHTKVLIRSETIVPPGDYAVVGQGPSTPHLDYDLAGELSQRLYPNAALKLWSCGVLIDQLAYRNLPKDGSWSLTGDLQDRPSIANDEEAAWCVDQSSGPGTTGSPGSANPVCP